MANSQTLRSLVSGSGTVSTTAGSKALTFSSAQSFKEGATVVVDPSGTPQLFTVDVGSGTSWTAMQNATSTVSGKSFDTSDTSTSRARGAGKIVPGARHTLYFSHLDDAAAADAYYYVDTLSPENGAHPYTLDPAAGTFTASKAGDVPMLIPSLSARVRVLEGIVRGASGTTFGNPDRRLDLIEEQLVPAGAIVMWSGTLASVPSGWALCDGSNGTPDLRDRFIKGWASGVNPGDTGGASTHTHADHSYTPAGTVGSIAASATAPKSQGGLANVVADSGHTHPAPTFSGTPAALTHNSPNHEPPYYKLAFIMKVGSYGAEGGSFLSLYSRGDLG